MRTPSGKYWEYFNVKCYTVWQRVGMDGCSYNICYNSATGEESVWPSSTIHHFSINNAYRKFTDYIGGKEVCFLTIVDVCVVVLFNNSIFLFLWYYLLSFVDKSFYYLSIHSFRNHFLPPYSREAVGCLM